MPAARLCRCWTKAGKPVPFQITYPTTDSTGNFLTHPNAASVVSVHKFSLDVYSGYGCDSDSGRL